MAVGGRKAKAAEPALTAEEVAVANRRLELVSELVGLRKAQGFSQERLSFLADCGRVTLARIETGAADPTLTTLLLLLQVLGKTLKIVPLEEIKKEAATK